MFALDPQLAEESVFVADLQLCRVLLNNNRHFPWLILVPMRQKMTEIINLSVADRHLLMDEIALVCESLQEFLKPHKLNVAALGNKVAQLHVHVIARFQSDAAWPEPVWGRAAASYQTLPSWLETIRNRLEQTAGRNPA